MHELDADLAAIGLADHVDDLAHRRRFEAEHVIDEDRTVEVGIRKSIGLWVELGMGLGLHQAQRVEPGFQVAAHAVGADQHQRADGIQCRTADLVRRGCRRSWGAVGKRRALQRGVAQGRVVPHGRGAVAVPVSMAIAAADDPRTPRRPARAFQILEQRARVVMQ